MKTHGAPEDGRAVESAYADGDSRSLRGRQLQKESRMRTRMERASLLGDDAEMRERQSLEARTPRTGTIGRAFSWTRSRPLTEGRRVVLVADGSVRWWCGFVG